MEVHPNEPGLKALMVEALDGNETAYRALLGKLSSQLRAFFRGQLRRINRGLVEAEDLVQETLVAVHTHRHTYDRSQLFTPWVYAIARYKFLDYLRRTKASIKDVPIEGAPEIETPDYGTYVESTLDLEKLLSELSPKARRAIQYMKLDGLSVRQTADRTGMSESAVKVSVHRGLKSLARLIRERT